MWRLLRDAAVWKIGLRRKQSSIIRKRSTPPRMRRRLQTGIIFTACSGGRRVTFGKLSSALATVRSDANRVQLYGSGARPPGCGEGFKRALYLRLAVGGGA